MSLAVLFMLFAAAGSPAGPAEDAVGRALGQYHAGLEAGDAARVLEVLGPTYFMADERTTGAERLRAHLFLSGDKLRRWPKSFLEQAGPYRNTFETISVSVRGDAAVVLTRDTGSNRVRKWRNEESAWLLGSSEGRWRIVGYVVRDIQLQEGTP